MSRMKPNDLTKIIQKTANYGYACNYRNYNVSGQILQRKSLMMPSFMVVPGIHMDTHTRKPEVWIYAKQSRRADAAHTLACKTSPACRSRASKRVPCAADRVAVSQLRGVALQCRGSVPSRSTDSERVWDRPYSRKQPPFGTSEPLSPVRGATRRCASQSVRGTV